MAKNESLKNSRRASNAKLSIIKRDCPNCGHDRALESMTIIKCARCKIELGYNKKKV